MMGTLEYAGPRAKLNHPRLLNVGVVALASGVGLVLITLEARRVPYLHGPLLLMEGVVLAGVLSTIGLVLALVRRKNVTSTRVCVAALCLLPPVLMPAIVRWQMEREGEAGRRLFFSEAMGGSVPASLADFTPVPETTTPDLVFHLKIAKRDMDAILSRKKFKPADPKLSHIGDTMYGTGPLSLGFSDEIYVTEDDNDVMTLRLNSSHTEGFLRHQRFMQESTAVKDLLRR